MSYCSKQNNLLSGTIVGYRKTKRELYILLKRKSNSKIMKKVYSLILSFAMIIASVNVGFANEKSDRSGPPEFVITSQLNQTVDNTIEVATLNVAQLNVSEFQVSVATLTALSNTLAFYVNDVGKLIIKDNLFKDNIASITFKAADGNRITRYNIDLVLEIPKILNKCFRDNPNVS